MLSFDQIQILLNSEYNIRLLFADGLQTYVHSCVRLECKSLNILQKNMRLQLFLLIMICNI